VVPVAVAKISTALVDSSVLPIGNVSSIKTCTGVPPDQRVTVPAKVTRTVPPPRSQHSVFSASVPVVFTPRAFPTPARESKAAEEQDWLTRNAHHIKAGPGAASSTLKGVCY
jgi:hypothetical protein